MGGDFEGRVAPKKGSGDAADAPPAISPSSSSSKVARAVGQGRGGEVAGGEHGYEERERRVQQG